MNLKDKIVKKLLNFGKKNRILVYPTLVMVAIVTAFSQAVRWGRSSGKKLVASMMIVALLISQSIFIKSSAEIDDKDNVINASESDATANKEITRTENEESHDEATGENNLTNPTDENSSIPESPDLPDDKKIDSRKNNKNAPKPEGVTLSDNGDDDESDINMIEVNYYFVSTNGASLVYNDIPVSMTDDSIKINMLSDDDLALYGLGDTAYEDYFDFTEICSDELCQTPIVEGKIDKNGTGLYNVYFSAKRTKYPISIIDNDDSSLDYDDLYVLPSPGAMGDLFPEFSYSVGTASTYNAYKRGYEYSGLLYGGAQYSSGSIDIAPSDFDEIKITYVWKPCELELVFDAAGDDDTHIEITGDKEKTIPVKITDDVTLYTDAEMEGWAGKEGYCLTGWSDGKHIYDPGEVINIEDIVENTSNIQDVPNVTCRKLTAVWEYKDINLNAQNSNCEVSVTGAGVAISATYGDEISCTIFANYKDSSDGSKFSYFMEQDDILKLGGYGLNVTTTSDGTRITSYIISGKVNKVTTDDIQVNLQVIDDNKPDGSKVSNHTVSFSLEKRPVSIDASTIKSATSDSKPVKVYDGSNTITVNPRASVTGQLAEDDVYVTFDSKATLDNSDAGKNKSIELKNVILEGAKKDNYYISSFDADGTSITVENVAEITRKNVEVSISLKEGETDSILFGQDTPVYTLAVVDSSELVGTDKTNYDSLGSAETRESFFTTYLGFTGWDTSRALYSPAGTYNVKPLFDESNSNYTISPSGIKGTFVVSREAGAKDVNYLFDKEMINGYYPGLTITPTGKYNKIRLIESGDGDIPSTASRDEAEALFSNSIKIPDMTDGKISFQLMGTSTGKGAVSEIITLDNMNVDCNPPEYVKHSVSPNSKFFNKFDFGSYFHKQNIDGKEVESATITVEYKSEDSACDKLYYFFADESGQPKGDSVRETMMVKNAANNYEGTIIVGTGVSGQIIVYAADKTGNISIKNKIKMSDIEEFIENGGSYYEWMVENTIDAAEINAFNMNNNPAALSPVWQNGIKFVVSAKDNESGVYKLQWKITKPNGEVIDETVIAGANIASIKNITQYGKILEYDFEYSIADESKPVGEYYAEGLLYDNAGNCVTLNKVGPFLVDSIPPVIDCNEPDNTEYKSSVEFEFTVTEGENESGISSVKVYKDQISDSTRIKSFGDEGTYNLSIGSNGTYIIVADDMAGNVSTKQITFDKISDVFPDAPEILVGLGDGEVGNDDWYIKDNPEITIKSTDRTSDGVPVTTYYKVKAAKKETEKTTNTTDYTFTLSEQGNVVIEAWSVSASGCKSSVVKKEIKVDTKAPDVYITESTSDSNGNLVINFNATDNISGVDVSSVTVNGSAINVEEKAGVVSGSFAADGSVDEYEIVVKDKAGNVSDPISFIPLSLVVSPIMDITDNSAKLIADIYIGTYDIASSYIAYRPVGGEYDTCLVSPLDTDYGMRMDCTFTNLKADTEYEYRVYVMTNISKETRIVEGRFKTAKSDAKGKVYGTVSYGNDLSDTFKTYPIYVNLCVGNTIVAGTKIDDETDNSYVFENVADGNYRIMASNGLLTKESSITIENGGVTYPGNYLENDGINFVLTGLSTRIVVEDGTICITADGLDKIYNTALFNGNITPEDLDVVSKGGTIDVALYASYMNADSVGSDIQQLFINKLGASAELKKYISLTIVKTVRDSNGNCVNNTPCNITRLAESITVSFPLEELAGQKIYVASVHTSDMGNSFTNWDQYSGIYISTNYVTISTDRFSVYALYKMNVQPKEFNVKWIDGNGKVLKSEKVKDGEKATPPNVVPTKAASEKYYYKFVGWDTDYSVIKGDTIIAAKFTAHEKEDNNPNPSKPTTEEPDKPSTTTEDDNENEKPTITTEDNENPSITTTEDNDNSSKPTTEKKDNNNNSSKDDEKKPATYTYMGSADSPATGDITPIEIMLVLMLVSGTGIVVLQKKKKNSEQ